jgi:hypothetical protein
MGIVVCVNSARWLADVAGESGMTVADVAFLAGLDESTVSRLWCDNAWLDRIRGKTLQAIIGAVPGVAELLVDHALARRRVGLLNELADVGLSVDENAFRNILTTEKVHEQWLSGALYAAFHVVRGDDGRASAHLARFWGCEQNRALGFIWRTGLVSDIGLLVEKATAMSRRLAEPSNSYHALVSHATLVHHVAKATGDLLGSVDPTSLNRSNAMAYRSGVIGRIMQSADSDLAEHYSGAVEKSTLLRMLERWAFPTFTRDAPVSMDFSVPRSMLLRRCACYMAAAINQCNDAYLHYLVSVALPHMFQQDRTLGLRAGEIAAKLSDRIDTGMRPATAKTATALLKALAD